MPPKVVKDSDSRTPSIKKELKELKNEARKIQVVTKRHQQIQGLKQKSLTDSLSKSGPAAKQDDQISVEKRIEEYHYKSTSIKGFQRIAQGSKGGSSSVKSASSLSSSAPSTTSSNISMGRIGPRRSQHVRPFKGKGKFWGKGKSPGRFVGKGKFLGGKGKAAGKGPGLGKAWQIGKRVTLSTESDKGFWSVKRKTRLKNMEKMGNENPASGRSLRTLIKGEVTKVRGRVASSIRVFFLARFLSHDYTTIIFETTLLTLYYVYFLVSSYKATFDFSNNRLDKVLTFCDTIFILDFFYRMVVQLLRQLLGLEYDLLYISSTPRFWLLHLIGLFPFEMYLNYQGVVLGDLDQIATGAAARLNRAIILFYRMFHFLSTLEEEQYITERHAFLTLFYMIYFCFVQATACALFAVVPGDAVDHLMERTNDLINGTWLARAYVENPGIIPRPVNNYLISLGFATTIVTTVGYGEPSPRNENEFLISIFCMLVGCIFLAGWFGSIITGFELAKDKSRFEHYHRKKVIQESLKSFGASSLFTDKVREYYDCLWNYREGVYKIDILKHLPSAMHEDIIYDICAEMFHKSIMFRGLDEPFLRAVSHSVEVTLHNPEMILCHQGERPVCMFYIIQGEVAVKTQHSANQTSLILRPGCIFGEISLFFSFSHTANIETKTCCQFLVIHRDRLVSILEAYPDSWAIMRARFRARLSRVLDLYEIYGEYPVQWVQRKQTEMNFDETVGIFPDYPVKIRYLHGCNTLIPPNLAEYVQDTMIVEMLCSDPAYANPDTNSYGHSQVPYTLTIPGALKYWHLITVVLGTATYIIAGVRNSMDLEMIHGTVQPLIDTLRDLDYLVALVNFIDIFVEILTATPSTGMFCKFKDGLYVKSRQWSFYVDIYSMLPYINLRGALGGNALHILNNLVHLIVGRGLKIVLRIIRYFDYLNDLYPQYIFQLRVTEATISLLIHIITLACLLIFTACPHPNLVNQELNPIRQCYGFNWYKTIYIRALVDGRPEITDEITPNGILNRYPLLMAIYFSVATLSSGGFGDFAPQSVKEKVLLTVIQLYGFYLIGSITAQFTSARSCTSIARITFENNLKALQSLFNLHGLTMRLRDRIVEHYKLQYQYNQGIDLSHGHKFLMFDAPPYLADEFLRADMGVHLEGVPIFSHLEPHILTSLAKLVRRVVLPPNITFLRRGDVRREMYIVKKGSVAIMVEDKEEVKAILEETGHFGVRDLLYGEPSFNSVKTLSYSVLLAIDYTSFSLACGEDLDLLFEIEQHRGKLEERIELLNMVYANAAEEWETKERCPTETPAWITFPTEDEPVSELCTYDEFLEPYQGAFGRICQLFLMRKTVHPAGAFALFWCLLTATMGLIFLTAFMVEYLLHVTTNYTRMTILGVKIIFFVDIYVRLHWAYYTELNHLECHPVRTATHYLLEGSFIFSVLIETAEYSFALYLMGAVNLSLDGEGSIWKERLTLIRLTHLFRLPIFFQFGHNVSPRYRTIVLSVIYVLLTLAMCSLLGSLALHFACPPGTDPYEADSLGKVTACLSGKWTDTKPTLVDEINVLWKRWILAIYYISQMALVIGYGDMVTVDRTEIILIMFVLLFGFIITRCIIADFSVFISSEDIQRAEYLEKMYRILTVMKKQGVDRNLVRAVDEHLQHTWIMSRGLNPETLLKDLHPALQSDFFKEYIGAIVFKVPLWHGINEAILRYLCTYMKSLHFTRGEQIAARGNLELEMYVIVEGSVWITGKRQRYQCTLGPGETFGETQMMYGLVRNFSAFAANNVEIFALNATAYAQVLDHYPDLKKEMEYKFGNRREDLFKKKIYVLQARQRAAGRGYFMNAEARITQEIRGWVNHHEVDVEDDDDVYGQDTSLGIQKFIQSRIIGWGSNDMNLPFLYFAKQQGSTGLSFMIHPKCQFYRIFLATTFLVSWASVLLAIFLTFIAEGPASGPFEVAKVLKLYVYFPITSNVFECFYLLHIILQFCVPFQTANGEYCKEHRKIAYRYPRQYFRFIPDIISTIPIQFLYKTMVYSPYQPLNLIRCFRIPQIFRSLHDLNANVHVTPFRHYILLSVTAFLTMAHVLAVLFYHVSRCHLPFNVQTITTEDVKTTCPRGTWTERFIYDFLNYTDPVREDYKQYLWYLRSLYWVITTVSTTGFGDIVPQSIPEIIIAIVSIFCGAFVLAYILSVFTAGITSVNRHHREYLYELHTATSYLGSLGLSSYWQSSLVEWFLNRWNISRGVSFNKVTEILPLTLRTTVNLALYEDILTKVSLFQDMDVRFFRTLVGSIEHMVFLPGQIIENEGHHGNTLYIIARGRIAGYTFNKHGQAKLMRWYTESCCFGRLPAFFYDQVYSKTYRSEVESEVLAVHKHSLFYLARYFPEFEARVQDFITATYDVGLGMDTIFTPTDMLVRQPIHLLRKSVRIAPANLRNKGISTRLASFKPRKQPKSKYMEKVRPKPAFPDKTQAKAEFSLQQKTQFLLQAFEQLKKQPQQADTQSKGSRKSRISQHSQASSQSKNLEKEHGAGSANRTSAGYTADQRMYVFDAENKSVRRTSK